MVDRCGWYSAFSATSIWRKIDKSVEGNILLWSGSIKICRVWKFSKRASKRLDKCNVVCYNTYRITLHSAQILLYSFVVGKEKNKDEKISLKRKGNFAAGRINLNIACLCRTYCTGGRSSDTICIDWSDNVAAKSANSDTFLI